MLYISPWSARRMRIRKNFSRCIVHTKIAVPTPVCKSSSISAMQRPIRNKFGTNVEKGQLSVKSAKILEFFCRLMVPFRVDGHKWHSCFLNNYLTSFHRILNAFWFSLFVIVLHNWIFFMFYWRKSIIMYTLGCGPPTFM